MSQASIVGSVLIILVGLVLLIYTWMSYKKKSVLVTRKTFDTSKWITKVESANQPLLFSAIIVGYFFLAIILIVFGVYSILH